jgi:hypothetical protein
VKLSIIQIVLGALIVLAACYVTGWMIHKAPSVLPPLDSGSDSIPEYVKAIPEHNELYNIARYGSYLLPVIGIYLLVSGAVENLKPEARNRNWVITDIVAGLVVAALGFIITTWGYPTTFHMVMPESSNFTGTIFTNPGRTTVAVQSVSAVMVLLGLSVIGVSIAQLVKSWKTTG